MAARLSAKKLPRYSLEFKRKAVKLTQIPGMEVQVVAEALDIHPVMLSRWRQEAREGRLAWAKGAAREAPEDAGTRAQASSGAGASACAAPGGA